MALNTEALKPKPEHPNHSTSSRRSSPKGVACEGKSPECRDALSRGVANSATDQITSVAKTVQSAYEFLNGNGEKIADAIYDVHSGRVLENAIARRLAERVEGEGLPKWASEVDFADAQSLIDSLQLNSAGGSPAFFAESVPGILGAIDRLNVPDARKTMLRQLIQFLLQPPQPLEPCYAGALYAY